MGIDTLIPLAARGWSSDRWASVLLFPLLVISFAFAQVRPMPLAVAIGQAASIAAILVAMVVVIAALPDRAWSLALVGLVFVARGLRFGFGESPLADGVYTVLLAALFSLAGALTIVRQPGLLQRQFAIFCTLSVPLMILQMIGVPWSQTLRTDIDPPSLGYQQVRTLFVEAGDVVITTLQSRPAGFLYANNAASLIAVFGVALHYARLPPRPGRLGWADLGVLAFIVLLMSRLAFIVLLTMWGVRLLMDRTSVRHILASIGVVAVYMAVYRFVFPGLFAANTSWYTFAVDLELRVTELMVGSGIPALVHLADRVPREWAGRTFDPMQFLGTGTQSGYAMLIRHGGLLLLGAIGAIPVVWLATRRFRTLDPSVRREVITVGLTMALAPAITSFLGSAMFWFLSAAAFIPIWRLVEPAVGGALRTSP